MNTLANSAYEGPPPAIAPSKQQPHAKPMCPGCMSDDPRLAHAYPCQVHSIKKDNTYRGIEVGENRWIKLACDEALASVEEGGGPFGAVIVQIDDATNHVIRFWRCRNQVTLQTDPTAHAEVTAVRTAAQALGVFDLSEIRSDDPQLKLSQPGPTSHCDIYSSCEPCPMCYAAIRWARINTIVFAATRYDAAEPGVDFSDLEL
ncbi:MAG: nucleoside deaminase, partial [Planctomycetales bacterium]|nr:nucleoside deaminase [Planctomycetales bacterium]